MNTNFSKIFKKPIYNFFITVYIPDSLTARKTKRKQDVTEKSWKHLDAEEGRVLR